MKKLQNQGKVGKDDPRKKYKNAKSGKMTPMKKREWSAPTGREENEQNMYRQCRGRESAEPGVKREEKQLSVTKNTGKTKERTKVKASAEEKGGGAGRKGGRG